MAAVANMTMKNLLKIALVAAVLATAGTVEADGARGYSSGSFRSSSLRSPGYVYRNPYSAYPSVGVRSYYRSTGTYVPQHSRTPANGTRTDNLNYRGYGTIRVPRY